jgi:hypothetical protein
VLQAGGLLFCTAEWRSNACRRMCTHSEKAAWQSAGYIIDALVPPRPDVFYALSVQPRFVLPAASCGYLVDACFMALMSLVLLLRLLPSGEVCLHVCWYQGCYERDACAVSGFLQRRAASLQQASHELVLGVGIWEFPGTAAFCSLVSGLW